jgi:hypothetical protein
MKKGFFFLFVAFLLAACGSGSGGKFATPESTFETLVAAIKARDLDAYIQCWHPERADNEGEVAHIRQDPGTWDELVQAFQGELKLVETGERVRDGKTMKRFEVESPDVENGIGGLMMVKEGDKWLMYSW